jgi:Recombination protein O N terminal
MGLVITEAIILKTVKFSDNSVICSALTADQGYVSFIASRGGKSNQSLTNHLRVMNILQLTYYTAKSSMIHRIKEASFEHIFQSLNIDVLKSICGTLIIEVVSNLVREEVHTNVSLFPILKEKLISLDQFENLGPDIVIDTFIALLDFEGFIPFDNFSEKNAHFNMVEGYFQEDYNEAYNVLTTARSALFAHVLKHNILEDIQDKIQVIEDLIRYFSLQIPSFKPVKSLEIFKKLHFH